MSPRPSGSAARGWWGILFVAGLALVGGFVGLAIAVATVADGEPHASFLEALAAAFSRVGAVGFAIGGVVIGGYGGVLLTRIGRPGATCPECGARNAADARVCIACEADLTRR